MAKLLIVDDEPFTVEMLETFLQFNGFETVGAFNGEDGLVMLKVESPELMILDLMLPDIEGYEVCRRLRSQPEYATVPVLVLSARAEASSRQRALDAGANAYLTKPVKFPELLAELTRLLNAPKLVVPPATLPDATPATPPAASPGVDTPKETTAPEASKPVDTLPQPPTTAAAVPGGVEQNKPQPNLAQNNAIPNHTPTNTPTNAPGGTSMPMGPKPTDPVDPQKN